MAYSAIAVANAFIKQSLDGRLSEINALKLQKLLYLTQAWHIHGAMSPILDDSFCRWETGPVIPSIHHKLKPLAGAVIDRMIHVQSGREGETLFPMVPENDLNALDLISVIVRNYGAMSAKDLMDLTRSHGSAWASSGSADGSVITKEEIGLDQAIHQRPCPVRKWASP